MRLPGGGFHRALLRGDGPPAPLSSYLLVALLPLVPGAGIYYAMRYCVEGETDLFLNALLHTFGVAAALSVGAMLASSVLRALLPRKH